VLPGCLAVEGKRNSPTRSWLERLENKPFGPHLALMTFTGFEVPGKKRTNALDNAGKAMVSSQNMQDPLYLEITNGACRNKVP